MNVKYKLFRQRTAFALALLGSLSFVSVGAPSVSAACVPGDASCTTQADCIAAGGTPTFKRNPADNGQDYASCQAGATVKTAGDPAVSGGKCNSLSQCDLVSRYLNPAINLLSAAVGIVIAISIVIGGVQYGTSAGDPQQAAAAKARIRNAIIALLVFVFLYALLNFLIPGGLYHG